MLIRYQNGVDLTRLPLTADVGPISVVNGVVKLKPANQALRGDANFDDRLDLSDPTSLLFSLFLSGPPLECPVAADFNLDGKLNLTDAVALLRTLFLGAPPPGGEEPREVPCR